MNRRSCLVFLFAVCLGTLCGVADGGTEPLNAVVRVYSIIYRPDYFIPWQNNRQDGCYGSGVVIPGNRVLTSAHNVTDATYIAVMKQTVDEDYFARVLFIDHDCDLALLEVEDASFFDDIVPMELGQTPPPQTPVAVVGFPIGGNMLSVTQGVISRIEARSYVHSQRDLLAAQLDAAINPGNSGGPVICDGRVVGIAFQSNRSGEGLGYMIPTEIIRHFLVDIEDGQVDGFGVFGCSVANLENADTRRYLGMGKGETGVRIAYVRKPDESLLKIDDVLLAIDGVKVTNNGRLRLPTGETRFFSTLIMEKQIGETVSLSVLRDGERIEVDYPIRKYEYLCKGYLYDKLPDYYIVGGFVFTTLSYSFLDEYGSKEPPPDLMSLMFEEKADPDEEAIVLSIVLGDRVNVGSQGLNSRQLKSVNGKRMKNLREFISFIENSTDEFITMCFGASNYPVTLDLARLRASTPAILERYRVPADRSKSLQ